VAGLLGTFLAGPRVRHCGARQAQVRAGLGEQPEQCAGDHEQVPALPQRLDAVQEANYLVAHRHHLFEQRSQRGVDVGAGDGDQLRLQVLDRRWARVAGFQAGDNGRTLAGQDGQ
jgi:hypothetical protein